MSDGIDRLPTERPDPPPDRRKGARRRAAGRRRRPGALRHRRPPRARPTGRLRQRPAQRRPGALLRQPAHQPDQRLRAPEHLRVLLLRPDAEGGGRVHPVAGRGVPRGGAGARACRRGSSTSWAGCIPSSGSATTPTCCAGSRSGIPQVHIKALTAVEIAHLARIERVSEREVLLALKEAGLTSLPGGGAEVFSTAVRATIAERKLTGEEWIRVHRTAHELGIPTNCTMLYGHVETAADRIEHLVDAARAAGRDRRLSHLHPAGLPPRPQRARRGAGTGGHRHDRVRGSQEHRGRRGCSSTTSRTSRPTGRW